MMTSSRICPLSEDQKALCLEHGHMSPRLIGGKLCVLQRFATTIGLLYNVKRDPFGRGYERRFCFNGVLDAVISLDLWEQNPTALWATGPWLKVKGSVGAIDLDYNQTELRNFLHLNDHHHEGQGNANQSP